jgi:RNA polymerase sigma factor (TIGR02999 family)
MPDVSRILCDIQNGDPQAADRLLPLVYQELRRLAAAKIAHEQPGQSLDATALVHEAYVRLIDQPNPQQFDHRGHFFAAAAEAMRRILVERARQRDSLKRGGEFQRVEFSDIELTALPLACDDLLALDEALKKLERLHPRKAELVKLRFFAGLSTVESAHSLGISLSSAEKDWAYARAWLRLEIEGQPTP